MGTVGLSFGSATGGTGFDVAATVTSILGIESAIETPWKAQLASLQSQDTALSGLGASLSSLSTAVSALTNFDGIFASKTGSSSNQNVLTLSSASSSAVAGSHTITVQSLAQTSSRFSDTIPNASDTLSGSFTLQIGSGKAQTITLDNSSNTLQTLASSINAGVYGVTASVVTSATGSRLSLVSNASGSAGQIASTSSVTDASTGQAVGFTTGQDGLDARFNVDGLETFSASNIVTGAIAGVAFQLSASSTAPVQVQIANDNASVETAVQTMVTAYNSVVSALKTQEGKDSTGAAEPLYGSPTLAQLQNGLSSALLGGTASGSIANLGQLGISLGEDGTLTLTQSTLDSTLNAHFSEVQGFLQNAGSFGQSLSSVLNSLGAGSPSGALALALAQNATQESGVHADISAEDARVATQKATLTTELTIANQILQSIPSQLNAINEIYSATTGYNPTTH